MDRMAVGVGDYDSLHRGLNLNSLAPRSRDTPQAV